MTKLNKLGKSTFVIAILSFLLVAVLAFGGTYAYFSAQSPNAPTGELTMGSLVLGEVTGTSITDTKKEVISFTGAFGQPNQIILNDTFKAQVTSNINYYTRVKLTITVTPCATEGHTHAHETDCKCKDLSGLNGFIISGTMDDSTNWVAGTEEVTTAEGQPVTSTSRYYYQLAHTAGSATAAGTEAQIEEFALKIQAKAILGATGDADGCNFWMDAKISVTVQFEVLQADYLTDGTTQAGDALASDKAESTWQTALAVSTDKVGA